MTRHLGWKLLAAFGAVAFVATALGGAVGVALALADGKPGDLLGTVITAGLTLVFWRWITLGAWMRVHPPEPVDGEPPVEVEPIGPWGVVGRLLLMALVLAVVGIGVWGFFDQRAQARRIQRVRDAAESVALDRQLTVAQIGDADAEQESFDWSSTDGGGAEAVSPLQRLLPLSEGEVVDASVRDGQGALLIRLPDSPPCVVLIVDRNDDIHTRVTPDCGAF